MTRSQRIAEAIRINVEAHCGRGPKTTREHFDAEQRRLWDQATRYHCSNAVCRHLWNPSPDQVRAAAAEIDRRFPRQEG